MVLNHDLFVRDKIKHEQKRKKEVPSVFMKPGLRRNPPDAILTQIVRPTGDIHNQDRGAGTATIVAENQ